MKLRQLQFTREIARCGTFSQAADICNATQPTLSNAVSQLEEELGAKIFARTTRSLDLTPFGAYLLPHIEAILDAKGELEKAAENYLNPDHKVLRIGLSPLVDMRLLADVLAPYRASHPDVSIYFKECLLDDLSGRLDSGSIDVGIVPRDMVVTDWDHLHFYADPLYYIPKDGFEPGAGTAIHIDDLPDTPIILTGGGCGLNRSLEILFAQNAENFIAYPGTAVSYPVIEEWAGLGIGAGILPRAKITSSRDRITPLLHHDESSVQFEFHWVWKTDLAVTPHVASLLKDLKTKIPALVRGRG